MDRNPVFLTVDGDAALRRAEERHLFCPNYGACLDEAVVKNKFFVCGACVFKLHNVKRT